MFQPNGKADVNCVGAEVANLQKHLQGLSLEQIRAELDALLEKEATVGIEVDPHMIEAYIEAMDSACPSTDATGDFGKVWDQFTANNPDLFQEEKQKAKSSKRPVVRFAGVAALMTVLLILSAAAFHWTDYVVKWGKELFRISPDASGIMALQEPSVDGYTTLEDALIDIGAENVPIPTWVPERYTIKTIVTQETTLFSSATSLYQDKESELRIRVFSYANPSDMPDLQFEKNDNNQQETYVYNEIVHYIYENVDALQVTWKKGSCLCSISGIISKEEAMTMIDSIYGG